MLREKECVQGRARRARNRIKNHTRKRDFGSTIFSVHLRGPAWCHWALSGRSWMVLGSWATCSASSAWSAVFGTGLQSCLLPLTWECLVLCFVCLWFLYLLAWTSAACLCQWESSETATVRMAATWLACCPWDWCTLARHSLPCHLCLAPGALQGQGMNTTKMNLESCGITHCPTPKPWLVPREIRHHLRTKFWNAVNKNSFR